MKKLLCICLVTSAVMGEGFKLSMKNVFVESCYSSAIKENSLSHLQESSIMDYCKCVFDVTSSRVDIDSLRKANNNTESKEYKAFYKMMMNQGVPSCLYNLE